MDKAILELLFELISSNIYAHNLSGFQRAIYNRFLGFRCELEFIQRPFQKNVKILPGGFFLPLRSGKSTLDASIYFTVSDIEPEEYEIIYRAINKMRLSKLMYIKIKDSNVENWQFKKSSQNLLFPVPEFISYDFQKGHFIEIEGGINGLLNLFTKKREIKVSMFKSDIAFKESCLKLLDPYSLNDIIHLYITRLVFDGFLGFNYYRGVPSDIDYILQDGQQKLKLIEVKEKYLSNSGGFGIDVRRLNDMIEIEEHTMLPYFYCVLHVDKSHTHFYDWNYIRLRDFKTFSHDSKIINGGTGMDALDDNHPTLVVNQEKFINVLY